MVLIRTLTLFALGALTACGTSRPRLDTPSGFLELKQTRGDYKATTADGARLWVREFGDPNRGELDFWADALEHDLVRGRGYELIDRTPTNNAAGEDGVLQRYRVTTDGAPHGYLIAVFSSSGRVRVAEFVAPTAVYEAHEAIVRSAITSMR